MLTSFIKIVAKESNKPVDVKVNPVIQNTKSIAKKKRTSKKVKPVPEKNLEYSKFVPLKEKKSNVDGYESENDGEFTKVEDVYENEDEDDMYKKQDLEWAEMMKDAECDDTDFDTESIGTICESTNDMMSDSMSDLMNDNDVTEEFSEDFAEEEQMFSDEDLESDYEMGNIMYNKNKSSEPKIKEIPVFKGISVFEDEEWIP